MGIATKFWESSTNLGTYTAVFDSENLSISRPLVARIKNTGTVAARIGDVNVGVDYLVDPGETVDIDVSDAVTLHGGTHSSGQSAELRLLFFNPIRRDTTLSLSVDEE